jgi:CDP-diacylglycerol--glycerol-3-phosphate 3-phosphatidyltransferase
MPSIYQLKPAFQNQLRPWVNQLASQGVTANQITLTAFILSIVTGIALAVCPSWRGVFWLLPAVLLLRMALNAIDGMLAREHGMKTPLGAILNELGDVLSDAALYLPFGLMAGVSSPLVSLVVSLSIISEMAGVLSVTIGGQRRYDGPLGKSDRAFSFSLISLLFALGATPGKWLNVVWMGMVILLVWTIVNRVKRSLETLKNGLDASTE